MTQQVKFDIGELIRAADVANIPTSAIPSDANPWTWKDPRAQSWQIAYRSINVANAQAAEVAYGEPLSLALQAALEGLQPLTNELQYELSLKRPHQHQEMREQQVKDALERMQDHMDAEKADRAERTPSPEEAARLRTESKQAAMQFQIAQFGTEILD